MYIFISCFTFVMPFVQGSKCCEQQEQHTDVSVMNHRILKILEGKSTSSSMNDTKKNWSGKVLTHGP
jgi:hypothetical protein